MLSLLGDDKELGDAFFDKLLMKSMVLGDRRPSYLPSSAFATTLLNVLSDKLAVKPRSGTPADFLDAVKSGCGLASCRRPRPCSTPWTCWYKA